jgi:RNA polymerase sigma factor (sigma-70 family)
MDKITPQIFKDLARENEVDLDLISGIRQGNQKALEKLIMRYQDFIFNISVRMLGNPIDAEDASQEILIKMITKLATFEQRSSFKTWLYRIVVNHLFNLGRNSWEKVFCSIEKMPEIIDSLKSDFNPEYGENDLLVEETKAGCLTATLICLDRKQRMVFIIGAIFGINSTFGAEILEISPENFRKILSRTRQQMKNFMNKKCGLLNESNPCRCSAKTKSAIERGFIDPKSLKFNRNSLKKINEFVSENEHLVDDALELKMLNIFRQQSMYPAPNFTKRFKKMINRKDFNAIINFN